MERIDKKIEELNARIIALKAEEVVYRQNIEELKSQQYLEDMKLIPIAQEIDDINKEIRDLNIAKSMLSKLGISDTVNTINEIID